LVASLVAEIKANDPILLCLQAALPNVPLGRLKSHTAYLQDKCLIFVADDFKEWTSIQLENAGVAAGIVKALLSTLKADTG
jgi:hypothetical protein